MPWKERYTPIIMRLSAFLFTVLILVTACSGYRFSRTSNPLEEDGIRTLSVPMFVNRSSLPNASAVFTQAMIAMLNNYPGLRIYDGENLKADAIMIGVITSNKKLRDVFKTETRLFTSGDLKDSIGDRPEFFVPTSSSYRVNLDIFVIKNPTTKFMKIVHSEHSDLIDNHPKVIIKKSFGLDGNFTRETKGLEDSDDGGALNQTKTDYFFEQSLMALARGSAESFRQVVLDVF